MLLIKVIFFRPYIPAVGLDMRASNPTTNMWNSVIKCLIFKYVTNIFKVIGIL